MKKSTKKATKKASTTTSRQRVSDAAEAIIKANPTGIRWTELFWSVQAKLPGEKHNTLVGALRYFKNHLPPGIVHPARGVYAMKDAVPQEFVPASAPSKHSESEFYEPFAAWLVDELEEATRAEAIGGSSAGSKWGTPDVIGLYEPRESDPIKFPREVVAAEIKTEGQQLIVAFGQACAYKLFAHRVYIVVPKNSNQNDLRRLDALAGIVGIGLVRFNAEDPQNPDFQVMVRAAKHEPDYYYTNDVISKFAGLFKL